MIGQINSLGAQWWAWMFPIFWQAALLASLVFVMDLYLRRKAWPQLRYAMWALVFARLVIPPSFALPTSLSARAIKSITPQAHVQPQLPSNANSSSNPTTLTIVHTPDFAAVLPATAPLLPVKKPVAPRISGKAWVMIGSAFMSALFLGWMIARMRKVQRMVKAARANLVPQHISMSLAEQARRVGLRRLPEIVLASDVPSPAVCGIPRHVLLLPESCRSLSPEQLNHVLLHELAHLKRGDLIVNAIQSLLHIAYWFNPAVWLAGRKMKALREICCDATVSNILREETDRYCATLVDAAQRAAAARFDAGLGLVGLFEGKGNMRQRIEQLSKLSWRNIRMKRLIAAGIAAFALACVLPMSSVKAEPVEKGKQTADKVGKDEKDKVVFSRAKASYNGVFEGTFPDRGQSAPKSEVEKALDQIPSLGLQFATKGDAVVPALVAALADADAGVRQSAADALASQPSPSQAAVAALIKGRHTSVEDSGSTIKAEPAKVRPPSEDEAGRMLGVQLPSGRSIPDKKEPAGKTK